MNRPGILITGGGGFVGSHLAEGLSALGYPVMALDRRFDAATRSRLAGIRLIEAELTAEALRAAMDESIGIVIHGAALTTPPECLGISEIAHVRDNVTLLIDCLDQAVAWGIGCFIFLSSSGVFAFDEADLLDEAVAPQGTSAYALGKRAGEVIALARPETLVLRLGPLYGPHEESRPTRRFVSPIRQWLDAAQKGMPLVVASPQSRRDWTFLPDLAAAIDRLIRSEARGLMHLTSGEIISDLALAETIAARTPGLVAERADETGPKRVPMVSRRPDLKGFAWTLLERGLHLMSEVRS
ncbi:NAD-dependent epimerase/dehydratase family protein [Rhizobium straminoryzae]|nr:NAD(P)-dependent oxidoreductase [Rhizobium straminoryzae]